MPRREAVFIRDRLGFGPSACKRARDLRNLCDPAAILFLSGLDHEFDSHWPYAAADRRFTARFDGLHVVADAAHGANAAYAVYRTSGGGTAANPPAG